MDVAKEWGFYCRALRELGGFAESRLASRLAGLGEVSARHDALRLIWYSARSVLEPLIESELPTGFRGHAVLCRSVWEHWVDFETIQRGVEDTGQRFITFPDIQAWNHFRRVLQLRRDMGLSTDDSPIHQPGFEERVQQLAHDNYGLPPDKVSSIKSWDLRDLYSRARALGPEHELHHREFYSVLSWSAHGSATGVVGMDAQFLDRQALQWRIDAFDHFLTMSKHIVDEFGWQEDEQRAIERITAIAVGDYESSNPEAQSEE